MRVRRKNPRRIICPATENIKWPNTNGTEFNILTYLLWTRNWLITETQAINKGCEVPAIAQQIVKKQTTPFLGQPIRPLKRFCLITPEIRIGRFAMLCTYRPIQKEVQNDLLGINCFLTTNGNHDRNESHLSIPDSGYGKNSFPPPACRVKRIVAILDNL